MKKMTTKAKIRWFLLVAFLLWFAVAAAAIVSRDQGSSVDPIYPNAHASRFEQQVPFALYEGTVTAPEQRVSGALLPDPATAGNAAAACFATLAQSETGGPILLIAFAEGVGTTPVTGSWPYQTSFGLVQSDDDLRARLTAHGVRLDDDLLETCVSVGAAMSYSSYYLPEQTVTPLVFDRAVDLTALAETLHALALPAETLVLVLPASGDDLLTVDSPTQLAGLLRAGDSYDLAPVLGADTARAVAAAYLALPAYTVPLSVSVLAEEGSSASACDLLLLFGEEE